MTSLSVFHDYHSVCIGGVALLRRLEGIWKTALHAREHVNQQWVIDISVLGSTTLDDCKTMKMNIDLKSDHLQKKA